MRWPFDLATFKRLYPISEPLRVLAKTFPFERLPPEIRLHILRFAMPQHGLRPTPKRDFDILIPACHKYATKVYQEDMIPVSLLLLNKSISSEVAEVLYKEVLLRIDMTPAYVRFLNSCFHM